MQKLLYGAMNKSAPVIVADMASSNARMKAHVERRICQHNETSGHDGKALFIDVPCFGHILMGAIIRTFALDKLIPRNYAVAFTFRFPPRFNRLVRLLRVKIEHDLHMGGYVPNGTSQPEWLDHTSKMLALTLLRPLRTRGRDVGSTGVNEKLLRELHQLLCSLLNTDVRKRGVGHCCNGCCKNLRETSAKIADAVVTAIVELIPDKLGSTNKLYTMEQAIYSVCAFSLVHYLGEDVIPLAIGHLEPDVVNNDADAAAAEADEAPFQTYCNRKARQASAAASDVQHNVNNVIALWAGEPLEKLSNTLQHLEAPASEKEKQTARDRERKRHCLIEATRKYGIVHEAEVELTSRATSSKATGFPLTLLCHHFEPNEDVDASEFEAAAFAKIVDITAQHWARVVEELDSMPLMLLQLLDRTLTAEQLRRIRVTILSTNHCCGDPACGRIILQKASR